MSQCVAEKIDKKQSCLYCFDSNRAQIRLFASDFLAYRDYWNEILKLPPIKIQLVSKIFFPYVKRRISNFFILKIKKFKRDNF